MKRLIKKSEFFDAYKDYANDYCEVFKNPTAKEYSELRSLSGDLRGIISNDGTIYAWDAEFLHDEVCKKLNLSMSDLHLVTYDNVIGFYCDDNFRPFEYLKNYKSQIEQFVGMSLDSVKIEFPNLFTDLISYTDYMSKMENNELEKIVAKNKCRIKVGEIIDAIEKTTVFGKEYAEIFKNPTNKEFSDAIKSNSHNNARGIINNNDIYIWQAEFLHSEIIKKLGIDGIRLEILNGLTIMFSEYSSDVELYDVISKIKDKIETFMGMSSERIQIASEIDYEFEYDNLQEFLDEYSEDTIPFTQTSSRLIKKSDKVYTWEEVCDIQSQGNGRISSLPFGNYGNFELKKVNINDLKDYFMTYDEMVSMDMDEDLSIFKRIYSALDNGEELKPIVIDKNMKLIDGSHRLSALYEMGYTYIDAFVEQ